MSKARELLESIRERAEEVTLKYRALDAAPLGITIADMSKDDEPLVYVNSGFEELTGYSSEEAIGRNCRFLQGEQTDPAKVSELRAAIENEQSVQVELRNYRKDGSLFWNEVTLSPISKNGEVPYYVGFQQDVTVRKEYERRLEAQRNDLDVLNQIVRHDIRNDLQIVLAALEIIEDGADDRERPHIERALESTSQAIELTTTAKQISDAMLRSDSAFDRVQLREVLTEQIGDITASYPDAIVEIHGTLPAVDVRADELLASVFRNLLTNAIQHNDKETPKVNVSATKLDGTVTVTVEDNGPGVPDDLKGDVFEKGVKGDESGTTGLGLYLVKRLVDNYGGDISLADGDPEGTTVTVTLQAAE